jgi:hypothetical protein
MAVNLGIVRSAGTGWGDDYPNTYRRAGSRPYTSPAGSQGASGGRVGGGGAAGASARGAPGSPGTGAPTTPGGAAAVRREASSSGAGPRQSSHGQQAPGVQQQGGGPHAMTSRRAATAPQGGGSRAQQAARGRPPSTSPGQGASGRSPTPLPAAQGGLGSPQHAASGANTPCGQGATSRSTSRAQFNRTMTAASLASTFNKGHHGHGHTHHSHQPKAPPNPLSQARASWHGALGEVAPPVPTPSCPPGRPANARPIEP